MATTNWSVDPAHSEVQFKVKHLVISTVTGAFKSFHGNVVSDGDNFENSKIDFSIDAKSIDTNQAQRDAHLRSPDFFESDKFPEITYASTGIKKTGDNTYKVSGNLSMRGVTKPVELHVEHGGSGKDAYGNFKQGYEVTATIHRKDFGINWNAVTEAGGLTVGEDVKLVANIQLAKAQ